MEKGRLQHPQETHQEQQDPATRRGDALFPGGTSG